MFLGELTHKREESNTYGKWYVSGTTSGISYFNCTKALWDGDQLHHFTGKEKDTQRLVQGHRAFKW